MLSGNLWNNLTRIGVAAAGVFALSAISSVLAQTNYDVIHLGTNGGNDSECRDINSLLKVVGWAEDNINDDHAFIWINGVMTDLGTLGGRDSNVRAINEAGLMAGRADLNYWFQHAASWDTNNIITDLGTLGGMESSAYGINGSGQIVGWADLADGSTNAFLYENGVMTSLGTLGGVSSWARDINDSGDIVGYAYLLGGLKHAFKIQSGVMSDMGTLGGPISRAYSINNLGHVVGESDTPAGPTHACLWKNGAKTDLGTLGGATSSAWDINNAGQIVGWSDNSSGSTRAFLYENGQMYQLNDLISPTSGWNLKEAYAITDAGEIVGRGNYQTRTRAFLLVPTGAQYFVMKDPTPGLTGQNNTFEVTGATAGATVSYNYSFVGGSTSVPGCSGLFMQLNKAKEFGTAVANGSGVAKFITFVPNAASGKSVLFQAYEQVSCRVTNLVTFAFP